MESCNKRSFDAKEDADKRLKEIKKSKDKRKNTPTRSYKCKKCGKYHLTHMSVSHFKTTKNAEARNKVRENKFIKIETEYWESVFNIN